MTETSGTPTPYGGSTGETTGESTTDSPSPGLTTGPAGTTPGSSTEGFDYSESFAGDPGSESDAGRGRGGEWLGQLQGMIDNVATQAAPVLRQIAAKAAELAATAGDKAGPIAHKAADATEAAGQKLAERGRGVAADLRASGSGGGDGGGAAVGEAPNAIDPGRGATGGFGTTTSTTTTFGTTTSATPSSGTTTPEPTDADRWGA